MATIVLRRGERVGFEDSELGWLEGRLVRASPNGEEWLVRTRHDQHWVEVAKLRPPREPQRIMDHAH